MGGEEWGEKQGPWVCGGVGGVRGAGTRGLWDLEGSHGCGGEDGPRGGVFTRKRQEYGVECGMGLGVP